LCIWWARWSPERFVALLPPSPHGEQPKKGNTETMSRRNPGKPVGENDEHYPHVALRWDFTEDKATRIIECRNRIQWIIQHKAGGRWRPRSFCRTRGALERLLPGKAGEIAAVLPVRFVS
jgi:hypothetical protein